MAGGRSTARLRRLGANRSAICASAALYSFDFAAPGTARGRMIAFAGRRVQIPYQLNLIMRAEGPMHQMMNTEQATAIHQALISVQSAVTVMTFPRCDQEDLIELIDRVEEQLHCSHPNTALMCTFLNSIARSLRAQPEAREACLTIEQAIEVAGMPSTWQSGI